MELVRWKATTKMTDYENIHTFNFFYVISHTLGNVFVEKTSSRIIFSTSEAFIFYFCNFWGVPCYVVTFEISLSLTKRNSGISEIIEILSLMSCKSSTPTSFSMNPSILISTSSKELNFRSRSSWHQRPRWAEIQYLYIVPL